MKPPLMPSARIYHLSGGTRGPVHRDGASFATTGAGKGKRQLLRQDEEAQALALQRSLL